MSYNGSGTFQINSSGQPVVTGTVISSTAFNALTADLATGLSTAITKDGQTTTTARITFAQGVSSTLVTDATSATTGSIITAGGISTQKALWVGTTSNFAGTMTAAAANFSGLITGSAKAVINPATTPTTAATATQLGVGEATNNASYRLNLGYWLDSGIYRGNIDAITGGTAATLTLNSTGGLVGIGMTPTNVLDITQNQNANSQINLLNNSAGTVAYCSMTVNNGTSSGTFVQFGTGNTFGGINRANGTYLAGRGAGGLTINTEAAQPIYFAINSTEIARVGSDGSFLIGNTTNAGAGNLSVSGVVHRTKGNSGAIANNATFNITLPTSNGTFILTLNTNSNATQPAVYIVASDGSITTATLVINVGGFCSAIGVASGNIITAKNTSGGTATVYWALLQTLVNA